MAARFGGEAVNKRDCIVIATLGKQLPAGIKAISKPRDEERVQKVLEERGKSIAPGVGIDLEIIQELIRADPTKELVGVFPDNPGDQYSKHHYLRRVEELMKHCKQPGAWVWYTGHSERGTGNWCFKDGTVSFMDIFSLYLRHFLGKTLTIIIDCCHSGKWVHACAQALDSMSIPPCGHKSKEHNILLKVYASCEPEQLAADPCYSVDAVKSNNEGCIILCNWKQLGESQKTFGADFTRIICCREPYNPCPSSALQNWRWKDAVSGRMRNSLYLVRPPNKARQVWYYVLLFSEDESYLHTFKEQVVTGRVDVSKWGDVLISGWGEGPPESLRTRVEQQTWV